MALKASTISENLSTAFKDDKLLKMECKKLAAAIQEKSIHLVTVVEALQPYITSNEKDMTLNSVYTLSEILALLPKNFLNDTEMTLLLTFYIERLKDHHSIIPATLTGILHLIQMDNLPSNLIFKMLNTMFSHIHCQSLQRSERSIIFHIFKHLIHHKINVLKNFESEFIAGFMSAIDGERDPRNLSLLFKLLPTLFKALNLGQQKEDMFEIIACYFPVCYNPIEEEHINISRDGLADDLSYCLYALPEFAEYCLPLIIDKLTSNLKVAKMDSLKLLRDSASTFGSNGLKPFVAELWALLKECAMSSDPEIKSLTLEVITKSMQTISSDISLRNDVIERIVDDTKWTMSNVELSSFWSSERILEAVAKADDEYCKKVLNYVIPLCLGQYSSKTSVSEKVIILKTLNNFLRISSGFQINIQSLPELSWTDIPALLARELDSNDNNIKVECLNCFDAQITFINIAHRNTFYEKICHYIETGNDVLKKASLSLLNNFAKIYPKEILQVVMNNFPLDEGNTDTEVLKCRLEALSIIAKEPEIGCIVLPKLVELALSISDLSTVSLQCLNKLLCLRNSNLNVHKFLYEHNAIDQFIIIDIKSADKFKLVSNICRSVLRKLSVEEQKTIFDKHSNILQKDLTYNCALYFEAILIPVDKNIIANTDVSTYFDNVTKQAIHSNDPIMRLACCKLVAVLIHKLMKTDFIQKYILPLRERLITLLKSNESIEVKRAVVVFHTWITKSIVIGGIPVLAEECINDQIDLLRHHEVGEIVAEEFRTLIDRNEDTLTKENGCKVMFLYRQRIFENLLIENVFDGAERRNFLIAFTAALEEVPIELLFIHVNTIVPILAESLTLYESKLLLPILRTLKLLLKGKHAIFITEVKTIIPNILQLLTHKEMAIRIAAVECLNNYCDYPSMDVYSFRPDVLDKLAVTIDDHKRLVRKIAVITRSRWFLYEEPFP